MKFHNETQINKIIKLQKESAVHLSMAIAYAGEANDLTGEMVAEHGHSFVLGEISYVVKYSAIGMGEVGNHNKLFLNTEVKVLK